MKSKKMIHKIPFPFHNLHRNLSSHSFLQKLAHDGKASDQYELACHYLNGTEGFTQNDSEARKWLMKSASQGYPDAEVHLGNLLLAGKVVRKSLPDALRHFIRAASKGHTEAMASAGHMLSHGIGAPKDRKKAFPLLSDASKAGNYRAMCELGFLYAEGIPSEKESQKRSDFHIAERLAQRAGDHDGGNIAKSQRLAGSLALKNDQSFGKAKKWFQRAAEGGDLEGMASLGRILAEEKFRNAIRKTETEDGTDCLFWLQKAANLGHKRAQRDLGFLYIDGGLIGIPQDIKQSVFFLSTAGLFDMPDAYLRLAEIYAFGSERYEGVEENVKIAQENIKNARKSARESDLPTLKISIWQKLRENPKKIRELIDNFQNCEETGNIERIWFGNLMHLMETNID